jgi:maltokinase
MTAAYTDVLSTFLPEQRWFAGKGREFTVIGVSPVSWLERTDPATRIELVTVQYDDGDVETYQVPVAYLPQADPELAHALIGPVESAELGSVVAYDAVFLPAAADLLLRGFLDRRSEPDLEFHILDDEAELPVEPPVGTVMTAEQSNTSIAYDDQALLKLYRRVRNGANPDVELTAALTLRGDAHVPHLLGWLEGSWRAPNGERQHGHLGMLQMFLRTATDGWDIALASVRDLFVEEDLHPEEVGGDFAGEVERLGAATADVHRDLAELFETSTLTDDQRRQLAAAMDGRLSQALTIVPELEPLADSLRPVFAELAGLDSEVPVQRIHGDLHLGQTLRTVKGWKLIDFEGEPAKTFAERTALDSPLRDVAGMLRSLDYATGVTLLQFGYADHLRYRADEWVARNRDAFLDGYASVAGFDPAAPSVLLRAYETDKAVYEAVYEQRNRPHWVNLPLHALERLAKES